MSSSEQPIIIKKRNRPNQRIREISREPEQAEASTDEKQGEGEIEIPIEDLIELRKFRKAREGIDVAKLNVGERKRKKKKEGEPEAEEDVGGLRPGAGARRDVGKEEEDDGEKVKRVVRANNFTQQTNALDVDKHMMAYIEENMKSRRGVRESSADAESSRPLDPQEELYRLPEKYKVQQGKPMEEGSVSASVAMLTAIPEVDLGMDARLKNIEETEKAKRAAAERKEGKRRADDEFLAATRFYKPTGKHKSDADIIRDAKLEAMGIRPEDVERRHQHRDKTLTATDEIVMERFKKRMRK